MPTVREAAPVGSGILNVLKAPGITSHGVVARIRRLVGTRRVGHGGTLDPGAAGVLPVLVGEATKLMPYVVEHPKRYVAEMHLGIVTDSQDASGTPLAVTSDFRITKADLEGALSSFIGEYDQVPPMTSAVRQGGQRLYELAREGKSVEREPRRVRVDAIRIVHPKFHDEHTLTRDDRIVLDIQCSKGTYVRTLLHDIGQYLGCGAHMSFLVRTEVGPFSLDASHALEELEEAHAAGRLGDFLLPLESALPHLIRIEVQSAVARHLRQGKAVPLDEDFVSQATVGRDALAAVIHPVAGLVCIARISRCTGGNRLQPVRVFSSTAQV